MATPIDIYRLILGLVQTNDLDAISEIVQAHSDDCPKDRLATYQEIGILLDRLISTYDYTVSPRFQKVLNGKSPAFVAMARKVESEPVKRRLHKERFCTLLQDLPNSDDIFDFASLEDRQTLLHLRKSIRSLTVDSSS